MIVLGGLIRGSPATLPHNGQHPTSNQVAGCAAPPMPPADDIVDAQAGQDGEDVSMSDTEDPGEIWIHRRLRRLQIQEVWDAGNEKSFGEFMNNLPAPELALDGSNNGTREPGPRHSIETWSA